MKSLLLSYSSSLSLYFPNAVKQTSSKWGSKRFFILSRSIKNKSIVDINTSSLFENKNILIMFWNFWILWWITLRIESIIFTLLCGLKTIMTFIFNEGTKRDNETIVWSFIIVIACNTWCLYLHILLVLLNYLL